MIHNILVVAKKSMIEKHGKMLSNMAEIMEKKKIVAALALFYYLSITQHERRKFPW